MKYMYIALLGLGIGSAVISCSDDKKKKTEEKAPDVPVVDPNGLKIAFYHSDSLVKNYTYWYEQDSILKVKQKKFESDLMARQRNLESLGRSIEEHRQKLDVTATQLAEIEKNFLRKQQDAQIFQQNEGTRLQNEAMEIQTVIANRLKEAGKAYCEKYKIDILLVHGQGGQIGYIKPSMDVTSSFISYLNSEHEKLNKDMGK